MDRPCTRLILAAIATVALGSDLDAEELGYRVELGRSVSVEAGWRLRDWGDNGRIEGPLLGAVVRF